ncbi:MAG TPA: hypothetical protein VGS22_28615 [Thermoanaerobaculia bacterium]|jgi:hypothetical protein|nr:hypothetical protein [Thermoanaerobaculia bacterium]
MRRFAVRFTFAWLVASVFTAPIHALSPSDFFSLIRNSLRFLWAEEGSVLDPSGRLAPHLEGPRWIGETTGSSIDPDGRPVPPPSGLGWLGAETGSSIDPNGRPLQSVQWPLGGGPDR